MLRCGAAGPYDGLERRRTSVCLELPSYALKTRTHTGEANALLGMRNRNSSAEQWREAAFTRSVTLGNRHDHIRAATCDANARGRMAGALTDVIESVLNEAKDGYLDIGLQSTE